MPTRLTGPPPRPPRMLSGPASIDFGTIPPAGFPEGMETREFTIMNARSAAHLTAGIVDDTSNGGFRITGLASYDARGTETDHTDGSRPLIVAARQNAAVFVTFSGAGQPLGGFTARLRVQDVSPRNPWWPMSSDLTVAVTWPQSWSLVNPFGLQKRDHNKVIYAGHVNDILELDDTAILVAADNGGVWWLDSDGNGIPLSDDWDNADTRSLAFGPDGPGHIFAGCGGNGALYVTDPANGPLSPWINVPVPDTFGTVHGLAVLTQSRRIVIATSSGLWWSPIPPPRGFTWTQIGAGLPSGGCYGAAEGPNESIVVTMAGQGLFWGDWASGALRMHAANIMGRVGSGIDPTCTLSDRIDLRCMAERFPIASCAGNRSVMYAVANTASGNNQGHIYALLTSNDGGHNWVRVNGHVLNDPNAATLSGSAEGMGSYDGCIAVSPVNRAVVALGWISGPLVSQDSGQSWAKYGDNTLRGNFDETLYADVHAVYFNPSGRRLYTCNDGGVVVADIQVTSSGPPVLSNFNGVYNRRLANLQFYGAWSGRTFSHFSVNDQLAAAGLQDHGDIYCQWSAASPWRQIAESDGGVDALVAGGDLFFNNTEPTDAAYGKRGQWNGGAISDLGIVPVLLPNGITDPAIVAMYGSDDPNGGLSGRPGADLVVEAVAAGGLASTLTGNQQSRVLAIGGVANQVYGLFPDSRGMPFWHWELLATLELAQNEFITAVGSFNGLKIFMGTNTGHIYSVTPGGAAPIVMTTPSTRTVSQFVLGTSFPEDVYALGGDSILQLVQGNSGSWRGVNLNGAAAQGPTRSLAVDWSRSPAALYVAKENRVFLSLDQGNNWGDFSAGLPRGVLCSDLRISSGRIFLSTWGRSLWSAGLWQGSPNPPPSHRGPVPGQHPPQPPRPRPA